MSDRLETIVVQGSKSARVGKCFTPEGAPYKYWASPTTLDELLKGMAAQQVCPFLHHFLHFLLKLCSALQLIDKLWVVSCSCLSVWPFQGILTLYTHSIVSSLVPPGALYVAVCRMGAIGLGSLFCYILQILKQFCNNSHTPLPQDC
jgi:hypothetical protein